MGAAGESRTAQLLGPLSAYGFHLLHDRRWSGSPNANIDHLVVGPSGVFVVDTKSWSGDVTIDASGLWQGQASRDEVLEAAQQVADLVRDGLVGLGLPPVGVRPVIALDGRDLACVTSRGVWIVGTEALPRQLLADAKNLTKAQVEQLLRALMDLFPPAGAIEDVPASGPPDKTGPAKPSPPPDALFDRADLENDAVAAAMRAPLEDWMIFLHPRQAEFAKRRFNGPALLRGSAGTGKTVVALHRMAYLAERRSSSVLFLSYVRTLPAVQRAAYERLSPRTADRVEFASLHGWANRLLAGRGERVSVAPEDCEQAYRDAWRAAGEGTVLDVPGSWVYWSEEVRQVIRGRRIASMEDYQLLARTGRGSRLGAKQREAVWTLKERYEENLRERGLSDWDDLLEAALLSLEAEPLTEPYASVVVDEVQDLTRTGVELVSRLAADGPDSLLLVGDSHQAVFAGGVSPRQAGISVAGRSTVLNVNYRNTAEILEFAAPLIAGDEDTLGDGDNVDPACVVERHGLEPIVASAALPHDLEIALVSCLQRTKASGRAPWAGMAVLCARVRDVARYQALLVEHGIPTIALEQWTGDSIEAVKVGTIKRAKGLEFLFVFLPEVDVRLLPGWVEPEDEIERERLIRSRRELYVAATRARDGLWVGLLRGEPTSHRPTTQGSSLPPAPGSLRALVLEEWGFEVKGPPPFAQSGWTAGGTVALACDRCQDAFHVYSRSGSLGGRTFRTMALVCSTCRNARERSTLPAALRSALSELGIS